MVMVCGCGVWWVRVGVVVVGGWGGLELWSHLEYFTKILNRRTDRNYSNSEVAFNLKNDSDSSCFLELGRDSQSLRLKWG